jgi:hypothetical protein
MSIDNNMVREIYAKAQKTFFVNNVAMTLANREPGDALKVQGGRKVHKPIIGFAEMQDYTPLSATSNSQNVSTENEELTVDRATHAQSIHINVDDTEKSQLKDQDLVARYGTDLGYAMKDAVEKRWTDNITAGAEIGSTSSPIDFTGANILDTVEEGLGVVDVNDVMDLNRVILVGPRAYRAIEKATANRETKLGDTTYMNGLAMRQLMDSKLVKSNNLPWSATLTLGANVTDGDSVTIAGVKFNFFDDVGDHVSGTYTVHIGGTADATADNLVNAIEGGGTAGTDYVVGSLTAQRKLKRNRKITGTNTSGTIAFTGYGDVSTSSDFTSSSNAWSTQLSSMFFTAVGATDLALQLDDGIEMSRPKPMTGEAHFSRLSGVVLHNSKTFTDGQEMVVKAHIDASSY